MNVNINSIAQEISHEELVKLSGSTPLFVFSKKKLLENYKEFKTCFPNGIIRYAMKANSEPELLQILADAGSGFEVASVGELQILKKLGIPGDKMIYGTSVKPITSIKEFHEYGVKVFAFDSFQEIEKIAEAAPGSKVYVRIRANDAGSVFKFSEKFGTEIENVVPLLLSARDFGLVPYGISFHVGSQASNPRAWAAAIKKLNLVIKKLHDLGIKLEVIDIGGGYPCQYQTNTVVPTVEVIAKYAELQQKRLPYELKLLLEPGRGMVGNTAIAIANVIARVERKGTTWLFLDLGVYNGLFETMAYQGSTSYPVTSLRKVGSEGLATFHLAGPTGDSPDVISRKAQLPADIAAGDKLIFHNVGAYSLSVTSTFNGFSKPRVEFI